MSSFLQSQGWMDFQKSLGRKTFEVAGAKVIQHELPFGKNYLYVPYGPEGVSHQFGGELRQLAVRQGSIFVKAEPTQDDVAQQLVSIGFKKSSKSIHPHKTVIIDLTQSEDDLLSGLHHKTRYNIKLAERSGVVIKRGTDVDAFWKLMKKTTERDDFSSHSKDYYQKLIDYFSAGHGIKTELWFAYKDEKPIVGTIAATHGDTLYFLHSASDHEFRSLKAPNLLRWTILLDAKQSGLTRADFWGIDSKKWPGLTAFKLGWTSHATGSGAGVIEYPGAFDLAISKFWYWGYSLIQKIR